MNWKAIGKAVRGTSHHHSGKPCEDALMYQIVTYEGKAILVCCLSDGAGSAIYGGEAAAIVVNRTVTEVAGMIIGGKEITEASILSLAEDIYAELEALAAQRKQHLYEFSCTYLGCILFPGYSIFFQTGDGAIVKDDGSGYYVQVWWPQNGEYQNTTSFLTDDAAFSNLHITMITEAVQEVALFTDGLQGLILNNDDRNVHQPFFTGLFTWLRKAIREDDLRMLDEKLEHYLNSSAINSRTDDDKTLFLASRLSYA